MSRILINNIPKFAEALGLKTSAVVKKLAFDLFGDITLRTPVDTGHARRNWQTTVGEPAGTIIGTAGDSETPAPAPPPPSLSGYNIGQGSVFIINNLPYIEALENGHSSQAPSGMVGLAVAKAQATINSYLS